MVRSRCDVVLMLQSLHSYCCSLPRFALPFTPIGGRNVTTASCDKVGTVWVTSTCSRQIKGGLCQSLTPQSQQLAELQVLRQKLPFYSSMTFVWLCVTFDFSQRWFCEAPVMKRTIKSNQIQCGSDIKQTWKVCVALEHWVRLAVRMKLAAERDVALSDSDP